MPMTPPLLTSRAVIGSIYNRLTASPASWVQRYSMKIDSKQETETYGWLGMVPAMREWIGGRQPGTLRQNTFAVTNKDYEGTLEVFLKELRRDATGQLQIRISEFARRALTLPTKLTTDLILNGASTACYDSQYFFDTDHTEGKNTTNQSNSISHAAATGTTPTSAEMRDAILEAVAQILGFKDDQNEPMNENARAFEVMVPTAFFPQAVAACTLPVVDANVSNLIPALSDFSITPVANPRLTWTDKMAVFRTDGDTKPFILQEEVPLNVSAVAEGSELEFYYQKHHYGVNWAGAVAYGFWQHACLVTFT